MNLVVLPQHLNSFSHWLVSKKYQTNTIRNYLSDLHLFFSQNKNELSLESISLVLNQSIGEKDNSRQLASIAKFCQFATDQQLISTNLFAQAKKHFKRAKSVTADSLLSSFLGYLRQQGKTDSTIKNYQSDLKQFFYFCEHQRLI
jgi:site-specific recombinase XerD